MDCLHMISAKMKGSRSPLPPFFLKINNHPTPLEKKYDETFKGLYKRAYFLSFEIVDNSQLKITISF